MILIATPFILFFILWIFYLAVMNLKRNELEISKYAKPLALMILYLGVLLDFIFNVVVGTLIFLQIPRNWLFTGRLERNLERKEGWRYSLAKWFCQNYLDPFDPDGSHCRRR
jgi:hypothetical protein